MYIYIAFQLIISDHLIPTYSLLFLGISVLQILPIVITTVSCCVCKCLCVCVLLRKRMLSDSQNSEKNLYIIEDFQANGVSPVFPPP